MAGSDRSQAPGAARPFGLTAPLGAWRPLDRWVAGYALLAGAVLGLGAARGLPGCALQAGIALAALAGSLLLARLTRDQAGRTLTLLRLFYPALLFWVFYHQVPTLWPVWHRAPLDGPLAALEGRLWGLQPAQAFAAAWPSPWLSELFCFAYFAYYLFVPAVGLTALLTRGYACAEAIIQAATLCFLACYTWFWLVPTVGPHYWFPPGLGPQLYRGHVFNHVLYFFTAHGEIRGGAFPSSHIAVALLLTLMARRATPALFPAMAAITALMLPAVVYLRSHYLLDVPAGILTGLLFYLIAGRKFNANTSKRV